MASDDFDPRHPNKHRVSGNPDDEQDLLRTQAAGTVIEDANGEVVLSPEQIWDALPDLTKRKIKGLTEKQRNFILLVTHGVKKEDAYRYAYAVAPTTKDVSVMANAAKLYSSDSVTRARLAIEDGAMSAEILNSDAPPMTKQWVLERLAYEADNLKKNSGSVRVRALELIGRAQGMFEDVQVVKDDRPKTADEAEEVLKGLLKQLEPAEYEVIERGPETEADRKRDTARIKRITGGGEGEED